MTREKKRETESVREGEKDEGEDSEVKVE